MKLWKTAGRAWTILVLLTGCEDPDDLLTPQSTQGPAPDPVATRFRMVGGDGQAGVVGQSMGNPLVVEVRDQDDHPMAGVAVTWTAGPGSELVAVDNFTGADGQAEATWKMGTQVGVYTATAETSAGTTTFSGSATPDSPHRTEAVSGDGQSAAAGSAPPSPLVVRVFDQFDNVVPDAMVTWNGSHSGSASPASVSTDADGTASTVWTLGCSPVSQTMTATAGPGSADFSATARVGPAADLLEVSGDGQEGLFGASLAEPIVVRVEDACGNPVAGATVEFEITSNKGGQVTPESVVTDASGEASTDWRLGFGIGEHTLEAQVDVSGVLLTTVFTARGIN